MPNYDALFEPLKLKGLKIRNRFLSTSHAPGLAFGGVISDRYIRYQAEKAKGGVGLTQFGGATAVSPENSCYYGQINGNDAWPLEYPDETYSEPNTAHDKQNTQNVPDYRETFLAKYTPRESK